MLMGPDWTDYRTIELTGFQLNHHCLRYISVPFYKKFNHNIEVAIWNYRDMHQSTKFGMKVPKGVLYS